MKIAACACLCVMVSGAWAGGPSNQLAKFSSVVRILSGIPDATTVGTFQGTGTIIANRNVGGKGWLAILTADHVVATGQKASGATLANLGIAQLSAITGNSNGTPAPFVRRMGSQKVDLAVLGITYGDYRADLKLPRTIAETDPTTPPASFTGIGYGMGLDADPAKNEWKSDGVAGECRFYNNKKFTISNGAIATNNGYENQVVEWKALAPGDSDAMLGQGVAFLGDSGGPYFTTTPDKETVGTTDIPIMSSGVFAVAHTIIARKDSTGAPVAVPYGGLMRGVYLNADYRRWINEQVNAVPEPGSLAAWGTGLAAALVARRRRPRL